MRRREFCKMMAAVAAGSALPSKARSARAAGTETPAGWNTLTQDYAAFCATPPGKRVFYAVENGRIIARRLEESSWHAAEWSPPPALPVPGDSWNGVPMVSSIPDLAGSGPYLPTWDSLQQYEAPEWYRDAKFGIWAHWSPQCVPEFGDWYARQMYMEKEDDYKFHLKHYGPQSRFGYKELCAQWTLLNWNPAELIERYKRAGARLFIALANHHDGFDTWNSTHQPWNAVKYGPHRDVVGTWAAEARRQGLRFGVSVHQARNWWWFQTAHGADSTGPFAGVPYDGEMAAAEGKGQWWEDLDPRRLYGVKHPVDALPDISYVKNFYDRTRDLIDQHDPDLLYFDDTLFPLGWAGMNIAAYFYNHNLKTRGGKLEAVANVKEVPDRLAKTVVADYERGLTSRIMPYAWQSETCIGDWHYKRELFEQPGEYAGYMHPRDVIHWMIDTVSKNGTFILNIPGKPDGTNDAKEIAVLDRISDWMQANGEAIYSTRPWKIFGEGPDTVTSGAFQGDTVNKLGERDIRFTCNKANTAIYAMILGWPTGPVLIKSLGMTADTSPGKIGRVELLGTDRKIFWKQNADGLEVKIPEDLRPRSDLAAAFKISLA